MMLSFWWEFDDLDDNNELLEKLMNIVEVY